MLFWISTAAASLPWRNIRFLILRFRLPFNSFHQSFDVLHFCSLHIAGACEPLASLACKISEWKLVIRSHALVNNTIAANNCNPGSALQEIPNYTRLPMWVLMVLFPIPGPPPIFILPYIQLIFGGSPFTHILYTFRLPSAPILLTLRSHSTYIRLIFRSHHDHIQFWLHLILNQSVNQAQLSGPSSISMPRSDQPTKLRQGQLPLDERSQSWSRDQCDGEPINPPANLPAYLSTTPAYWSTCISIYCTIPI